MKTVLTIAGSDCSGGAGIQADIKTMIMNGVYAMSAITALTAQNTTGVYGIQETSPEFLDNQLDCIFTDIFPDAVKIGMLSSAEIMHHVAVKLQQYHAHHIVLDPVMISTSGHRLMDKDAEQTLQKELFPLAEIITPNIPEAEALTGLQITNTDSMEEAAHKLYESFHISVLLERAAIASTMQMTFFIQKDMASGCMVNTSTIQILTAPAAHFPVRLPQILPEDFLLKILCAVPSSI